MDFLTKEDFQLLYPVVDQFISMTYDHSGGIQSP